MLPRAVVAVLVVGVLPGCNRPAEAPSAVSTPAAAVRWYDAAQVARGRDVFRQSCAVCHGARAEGAPNWQRPGPDGRYPAPPLNGTAHDWHHPLAALRDTVRNGTVRLGGGMPAWKDRLSDADIDAAIAWIQSRWPDELYAAWARMDGEARRQPRGRRRKTVGTGHSARVGREGRGPRPIRGHRLGGGARCMAFRAAPR